jgi:hypothetical protein
MASVLSSDGQYDPDILALVGNLLFPRTDDPSDVTSYLAKVADSNIWVGDHVGILLGVLLTTGGFVALYRSITTQPGAALARLGFAAALVSAPILFVVLGAEAIGLKQLAGTGGPAAEAVYWINSGIFTFWIIVFGFVPSLYGLAIATSQVYPKWLGWLAIVGGVGSSVVGVLQAYNGPSALLTYQLFPIFAVVVTVWTFIIGVLMWRKASAPA